MTRIPVTPRKWQPTDRNIQVLAAMCATGDDAGAALALGISARVVSQHVRLFLLGTPAVSRAQACWIWRDRIAAYIADHP